MTLSASDDNPVSVCSQGKMFSSETPESKEEQASQVSQLQKDSYMKEKEA